MDNNLTPRQDSFCVFFTSIGSDTYGNGTRSALKAEYAESSAAVTATRLLKQEPIRNRIAELRAEILKRNHITVDKVLSDLEHDKLLAREHHQYGVAKGCTELQGKYLAMFTDKMKTETTEKRIYTKQEVQDLFLDDARLNAEIAEVGIGIPE